MYPCCIGHTAYAEKVNSVIVFLKSEEFGVDNSFIGQQSSSYYLVLVSIFEMRLRLSTPRLKLMNIKKCCPLKTRHVKKFLLICLIIDIERNFLELNAKFSMSWGTVPPYCMSVPPYAYVNVCFHLTQINSCATYLLLKLLLMLMPAYVASENQSLIFTPFIHSFKQ